MAVDGNAHGVSVVCVHARVTCICVCTRARVHAPCIRKRLVGLCIPLLQIKKLDTCLPPDIPAIETLSIR